MSEYNMFPSVDANLQFPPSVKNALLASQEFTARFGRMDNTSDIEKPISTAVADALASKAPKESPTFTGTVSGISKAMVGLGNVDNTSDMDKPVSTAQRASFVNRWSAGKNYAVNDVVITPWNTVMSASVAHISSASFTNDFPKWKGMSGEVPFGHMGRTQGFQAGGTISKIVMAAAQELKGGMGFSNTTWELIIPKAGRYLTSVKGYFSGDASNINHVGILVNGVDSGIYQGAQVAGVKQGSADISLRGSIILPFALNDRIALFQTSSQSAWGTTGYNGSFLELLYIGES